MKTGILPALGLFALFAALAALPMADVLVHTNDVLAFNDGSIEASLSPTYHFPEVLLRMWDNQFFLGTGNVQAALNVQATNESLFGPHEARRGGVLVVLALCGLATYWACRQFRISRPAAAFAAGATMLSGVSFSFAVAGLYVRPVALACSALALAFAERGRVRDGWLEYLAAGGCTGLAVAEVPDVGAFLALTVAACVVCRHVGTFGGSPRALLRLALRGALLGAAAILIAWQTVVNVSSANIQGVKQGADESPAQRYAWATQWSIPKAETWDIVAGSHFGASMNNPEIPYWGGIGSSEDWAQTRQGFRNFRMSAWYAGVIPSALLLSLAFLALRRRRTEVVAHEGAGGLLQDRNLVWMVLGGCLITLMLSWGKHFPLYRLLWSLPYFGTIRNPDKWNGPFMLFMTLGVALALDHCAAALRAQPTTSAKAPATSANRPLLWALAVLATIAAILLFGTAVDRPRVVNQLAENGFGAAAPVLWSHMLWVSFKVMVICALFGGAVWWSRRQGNPLVMLLAAALLTAGDLADTGRYFAERHSYKTVVAPNALTEFIDEHTREGRINVMPPPPSRAPNDPNAARNAALSGALNQMRMTMLLARGYALFNPVSVSRMPTDYESLFSKLGYVSPRLFELGSIRWLVTVPGICEALNQMDGQQGRFVERLSLGLTVKDGVVLPVADAPLDQRVLRVVEFTGALPLFQPVSRVEVAQASEDGEAAVLARLAAPDFDPRRLAMTYEPVPGLDGAHDATARVEIRGQTPAETTFDVDTDAPVLLVHSTKYDSNWKIIRDGQPQGRPLRVNYLFQGIPVPAGKHTFVLRYAPPLTGMWVTIFGRLALLGVLVAVALRSRRAAAV